MERCAGMITVGIDHAHVGTFAGLPRDVTARVRDIPPLQADE